MKNKTIVVFGGSFNPPTNSHFSLAEQILSEYDCIEKILFAPVCDLYKKPGLIPSKHRVAMLQSVCKYNDKFEVSLVEVNSSVLLNTIDTLKVIQAQYPEHSIWFTIGTDNLKEILKWKKYEELISRFKLLVLERDMDKMSDIIKDNCELKCYEDNFIKVKETVRSSNSSTLIRDKLMSGKSIRYLVPDEVYFYIIENKLY